MENITAKKYEDYILEFDKYKLPIGEKTLIMGILNVTPDSFSDGGKFNNVENAVKQAKQMVLEGADIIDIGGESTRPGSAEVGRDEELNRVVPIIKAITENADVNIPISIDTYKASVGEAALSAGATIINDVWGLQREPELANVAAKYGAPVIMMHNQDGTDYDIDIIEAMKNFFKKSIEIAKNAGIPDSHIFLDPGIGFGKTSGQNIKVMSRIHELNDLGYPVLLGTSRKSMIGKILDAESHERVEGTISTNVIGIMQGVEIIRVHDVLENSRAAKVADAIVRGGYTWIK